MSNLLFLTCETSRYWNDTVATWLEILMKWHALFKLTGLSTVLGFSRRSQCLKLYSLVFVC